ncbi:hypothetical protein RAS1_24340 [Phycisphaerae bacterium RAS1]|nr:hypothetical protein RAS1_24340 [Phycisphaerae bacterium RAS1]
MSDSDALSRLRSLHRAFSPDPLTYDQKDLYVDLQEVRGHTAFADKLAKMIRSRERCTLLLSGHPGAGKSTELRLLQHNLANCDPRYFTVICDLAKEIEVLDVDIPDLLIAVVRRLVAQLADAGVTSDAAPFRSIWDRIRKYMPGSGEIDLQLGLLSLTTALKSGPEARRDIREALEPHTGGLLAAANDVIGKATLEVQKTGYSGLVLIVDDLEKMALRENPLLHCASDEYLFLHRGMQLQGLKCHTIYTMPLTLAYSTDYQNLASKYGTPPLIVPMTQLRTRPPQSGAHAPGVERFREIIVRRLESLQMKPNELFESDVVRDQLVMLTGGQPRELMILIGEALIAENPPLTSAGIERAARELRRAFARQLSAAHWPILRHVDRTGQYMDRVTHETEPLIRELIYGRAILQYCNDAEWYGVNPLIQMPPTPP